MDFVETELPGVFVLDVERQCDERGFFARYWCADEQARRGIDFVPVQGSTSSNPTRGTLRGLHYQAAPHQETKLVRCTRGAIFDVLVDLRPASPTYGQWLGLELTAASLRQVLVPGGIAHGFLTLEPDTDVSYLMATRYVPAAARGLRWDDPAFGIGWPAPPVLLSDRDRHWPDWPAPAVAAPRPTAAASFLTC